jgi:hypothetical protein
MRRRTIAIVAAAAALAVGGTAVAASDELFPASPKEREAQFAKELSANLNGVTPAEMQRALEKVREQHMAEHRAALAHELAPRLDASEADVEQALEKAHQEIEKSFEAGKRPDPGVFVQTLAKELGKSESEVRQALQAAHRALLGARLDAAVKAGRLTQAQADRLKQRIEQGDGPFGRGPGMGHGPGGPGLGGPGAGGPTEAPLPAPGE